MTSCKRKFLMLPLVLAVFAIAGVAAQPASAEVKTIPMRTKGIKLDGYLVKVDHFWVKHPKINGYITKMSAQVVDAAGNPIPVQRIMLHHLVFHNFGQVAGKYNSTCNAHAEPFM